jgi:hypothetical protein
MFTLIKREIVDHIAHLILAVAFAATMVGILVYLAFTEFDAGFGVVVSLSVFALVGCCSMGVAQVYADRANKISPFLATLAVTRGRILAARCIAGVFAILVVLVPTVVAAVVLLRQFPPPMVFYWRVIVEVSATLFLFALACYCLGLLIGSTTRKLLLVVGCLVVPLLMTALIVVKGFGPQVMAVLGLLILAAIGRIVTKFSSTPL